VDNQITKNLFGIAEENLRQKSANFRSLLQIQKTKPPASRRPARTFVRYSIAMPARTFVRYSIAAMRTIYWNSGRKPAPARTLVRYSIAIRTLVRYSIAIKNYGFSFFQTPNHGIEKTANS
jgi:hypothetical protein